MAKKSLSNARLLGRGNFAQKVFMYATINGRRATIPCFQ